MKVKELNYNNGAMDRYNYYYNLLNIPHYEEVLEVLRSAEEDLNAIVSSDLCEEAQVQILDKLMEGVNYSINDIVGWERRWNCGCNDDNDSPCCPSCTLEDNDDDDEVDLEDDFADEDNDDDDEVDLDDFACGCCDRWTGYVCIGPDRFYVEGFGIIDSNGKLVEEIDNPYTNDDNPYTDDDEVDLEDDFAEDDEEDDISPILAKVVETLAPIWSSKVSSNDMMEAMLNMLGWK